ncbi:hypothetical protein D3C84_955970 [compost metagenome]
MLIAYNYNRTLQSTHCLDARWLEHSANRRIDFSDRTEQRRLKVSVKYFEPGIFQTSNPVMPRMIHDRGTNLVRPIIPSFTQLPAMLLRQRRKPCNPLFAFAVRQAAQHFNESMSP